jgi:RNA polymerase sigma-70 factor (ECF subfamily)
MSTEAMATVDQEQTWVRAAQQGDAAAFRCLVDCYDRRVLYFVLRFLPDSHQALDVMQEVWLAMFRRLPALRAPGAFRVWLYQIAHDQVVSLLRRQFRQEKVQEKLADHFADPVEANHESAFDQAELVHKALDLLSPEHREVLVLRFLEDLSLEEIAEALRCRLGTVKSRLHYAKRRLRQQVERLSHE